MLRRLLHWFKGPPPASAGPFGKPPRFRAQIQMTNAPALHRFTS